MGLLSRFERLAPDRRGLLGSFPLVACLLLLISPADAEEPWTYTATAFVDRSAVNADDDEPGTVLRLQPRYGGGLTANRTYDVQTDRKLALGFGVSTERYPETSEQNRLFFDAGMDYIVPLNKGTLRQLQFGIDLRHADDDDDWIYNRARIEASLRFQPARRNTIRVRGRVGYRDQNDNYTFEGYDQAEYLIDLMHNWRSVDGLWRTTSMLYYEHREADSDYYTYNEAGVRLIGRRKLTDATDFVGRITTFVRDYEDGIRKDHRFRGTLGIDWNLGNEVVLESYAGYQKNWSTLEEKAYSGGIFGIAISKVF